MYSIYFQATTAVGALFFSRLRFHWRNAICKFSCQSLYFIKNLVQLYSSLTCEKEFPSTRTINLSQAMPSLYVDCLCSSTDGYYKKMCSSNLFSFALPKKKKKNAVAFVYKRVTVGKKEKKQGAVG